LATLIGFEKAWARSAGVITPCSTISASTTLARFSARSVEEIGE
jgi:hypothetical protein